jgi:hypothetical protein
MKEEIKFLLKLKDMSPYEPFFYRISTSDNIKLDFQKDILNKNVIIEVLEDIYSSLGNMGEPGKINISDNHDVYLVNKGVLFLDVKNNTNEKFYDTQCGRFAVSFGMISKLTLFFLEIADYLHAGFNEESVRKSLLEIDKLSKETINKQIKKVKEDYKYIIFLSKKIEKLIKELENESN